MYQALLVIYVILGSFSYLKPDHMKTQEEIFSDAVNYEQEAKKGGAYLSRKDQRYLFSIYSKLASEGHACANERVVWYYLTGNVTRQNFSLAFEHASKALEMGCDDAFYAMAYLYDRGRGTEQDMGRSVFFYRQSALTGNGKSAYRLYEIFRNGYGSVGRDLIEAHYWLVQASANGNANAEKDINSCQYNGFFCEDHLDIRF